MTKAEINQEIILGIEEITVPKGIKKEVIGNLLRNILMLINTEVSQRVFVNEGVAEHLINILDIPEGVIAIEHDAFRYSNISKAIFPESLTEIRDHAFNQSKLKEVNFPKNIHSIGEGAFTFCPIESVDFHVDSTMTIETQAFYNCQIGGTVIIPIGITQLGDQVFQGNNISEIVLHGNIVAIPSSFASFNQLTSLIIPEGIESIGNMAFEENQLLVNITFPSTLISIGDRAFLGCDILTDVSLPSGCTLGEFAFDPSVNITYF